MTEQSPNSSTDVWIEEAEARIQDLEDAKIQSETDEYQLNLTEITQRINMRRLSMCTAIAVICLMFAFLVYSVFIVGLSEIAGSNNLVPPVIVIVPLTSITIITFAFVYGTFQKIDESSLVKLVKGVIRSADTMNG